MAYVTHKEMLLGFGLQTALGVPAATPTHIFPLPEGTDFGPKVTREVYENNQGNQERAHFYTKSIITEGTVKIPLVPGLLATSADLTTWLWARDANMQGSYATFWASLGNSVWFRYQDIKCTGGSLDVAEESMVYLSAKGLGGAAPVKLGATPFPAYSSGVCWDGAPYTYKDAEIQLGFAGGAYAADFITKGHSLEWDNKALDAGAATCIVYGRTGPYAIPNGSNAQWKGGFSRFFYDIQAMTDYLSETNTGSYKLLLGKGATLATLTFPRIVYVDGGMPKLPADGVAMNDGLSFEALGGLGSPGTPCFTWTES